jgi:pyruvate-formate lyase-activating enzyme
MHLYRKLRNLLSKCETSRDFLLLFRILGSFIFFAPRAFLKKPRRAPPEKDRHAGRHTEKVFLFVDFFFRRNILWFRYSPMKRALILYHHLSSTGQSLALCTGAKKGEREISIDWWLLIDGALVGHNLDGKPPLSKSSLDAEGYLALYRFAALSEGGDEGKTALAPAADAAPLCREIAQALPAWIRGERWVSMNSGASAGEKVHDERPCPDDFGIFSLRACCSSGWHHPDRHLEEEWIWSKEDARLILPSPHDGVSLMVSHNLSRFTGAPVELTISDTQGDFLVKEPVDDRRITIDIPPNISVIKLSVPSTTMPSSVIPGSPDTRQLGICLHRLSLSFTYGEKCAHLPRHIEFETTRNCNIVPPCVMCPRGQEDRDYRLKAPDLLMDRLMPHIRKARSLSLHGIGEPLTDERIFGILESLDEGRTWTAFSTNGLLLDDAMIDRILELKVKHLSFSLDAADPRTYQKLRGRSFFQVKEAIKSLARAKRERDALYPLITISMVLMKENFREARALVECAAEVGAHKVLFQLLNPRPENVVSIRGDFVFDYFSQITGPHDDELMKELKAARSLCLERGIIFETFSKELYDCVSE